MDTAKTTEDALGQQSAFFDAAFTENTRKSLTGAYAVCTTSSGEFTRVVTAESRGAAVLEFGCGDDSHGLRIAHLATHVDAIDISPVGVRLVSDEAERRGITNLTCHVMNAEQLEFPDATFDLVCGSAILHHLSLGTAMPELRRVLKPGGKAVFFEPLGMNPFITLFRRLTPKLRVPDEHPLRRGDLAYIREVFPSTRFTYYHLLSLLAIPFASTRLFDPLHRVLEKSDRALFRIVPPLERFAWVVLIVLAR